MEIRFLLGKCFHHHLNLGSMAGITCRILKVKKMAYKQYHKLIHKLAQVIPHDKSSSDENGTLTSLEEEKDDDLGG